MHFFAAEAEYGAFYMPMLAEILNKRHGFTVSISYSLDREGNIDSRVKEGLTGFDRWSADLLVVFTRSKYLTKETAMQFQNTWTAANRWLAFAPLTTALTSVKRHRTRIICERRAGRIRPATMSHVEAQVWRSPRRQPKRRNADRHLLHMQQTEQPILRGVKPYPDPRHLYILLNEPGKDRYDFTALMHGKARKIFDHKKHLPEVQPTVIFSEQPRRTVYSSTGADTFKNPNARRLALQGIHGHCVWKTVFPRAASMSISFDYQIPEDTHLREGDPHRGWPAEVFVSATPADDYQMVLMPAADKSKRLALLAETHLIKGGSETFGSATSGCISLSEYLSG